MAPGPRQGAINRAPTWDSEKMGVGKEKTLPGRERSVRIAADPREEILPAAKVKRKGGQA